MSAPSVFIDSAIAHLDEDVRICVALGLTIEQAARVVGVTKRRAEILRKQTRKQRDAILRGKQG